jgi:hypothetical protein
VQNIGCCFYGLQRLSGQTVQARELVKMIVSKGASCNSLGTQEFSMSLYGLRKMKYCAEVENALLFLSSKLAPSSLFSTEMCFANSLNGIQSI